MSDVTIPEDVRLRAIEIHLAERKAKDRPLGLTDYTVAIAKGILAERERCAKIADEEAEAMAAQRDELLDHGTLGDKPFAADLVKSAAKERRILREGYLSIAQAIRSSHE